VRIIVYTGKGGVGKTSVAAATALRAAELGYRTIVLSTDAAHSLGDSFDRPIGPEPVAVAPNLWVQEVDSRRQLERNWGKIRDYLTALFRSKQVGETLSEISVEELVVFPGLEELFCLLEIKRHHEEGRYDVIIMDCAPTGETLRLLSYPDLARWWLQRIFPVQRAVLKIARPVAQPLVSVPLPTVDVLDTVASFVRELEKMHALLTDTTQSSLRLVVNAEKMVIKEACRSFTYFNLFGFPTDLVVINRLLPAEVGDDYFRGWKDLQEKYVAVIEQSFAPLPIFRAPLFEHEVVGEESLRALAQSCFGAEDPTRLFYQGFSQSIVREGDGYLLSIRLPFVEKGQVSLAQKGDELQIQVGEFKRNVLLPRALVGRTATSAGFTNGVLKIRFGGETRDSS